MVEAFVRPTTGALGSRGSVVSHSSGSLVVFLLFLGVFLAVVRRVVTCALRRNRSRYGPGTAASVITDAARGLNAGEPFYSAL